MHMSARSGADHCQERTPLGLTSHGPATVRDPHPDACQVSHPPSASARAHAARRRRSLVRFRLWHTAAFLVSQLVIWLPECFGDSGEVCPSAHVDVLRPGRQPDPSSTSSACRMEHGWRAGSRPNSTAPAPGRSPGADVLRLVEAPSPLAFSGSARSGAALAGRAAMVAQVELPPLR